MTIIYNETFKQLLTEYSLPEDFSFYFALPAEVQRILDDQILITGPGVTLKSLTDSTKLIRTGKINQSDNILSSTLDAV